MKTNECLQGRLRAIHAWMWAFAALAIVFAGCTWRSEKMPEQVVVKVNDRQLTLKEFAERLSRYLKNFDAVIARSPEQVQRGRDSVIREFLLDSLIEEQARTLKIDVSDKEWDDEVETIRSGYPDDISFRKVLAEENMALAEWKDQVRHTVLKRKVFQALGNTIQKPTEDTLKKYYEENKDRFRYKERILLRQIVLDDLGKAEDVLQDIKKQKKDFAQMAKKFSVAPERKNGGLVGWVEKGALDIFEKAFSLPVNGVSPVLESSFGFHIFKVEKKDSAGVKKFEEVRNLVDQLVTSQREQKEYTQWLDKQIRQSKVSINYDLINQLKVETRIQE